MGVENNTGVTICHTYPEYNLTIFGLHKKGNLSEDAVGIEEKVNGKGVSPAH